MRHLLSWLLLAIRPDDGQALLGDLEPEYPSIRRSSGWIGAQVWYARELCAAVGYGPARSEELDHGAEPGLSTSAAQALVKVLAADKAA